MPPPMARPSAFPTTTSITTRTAFSSRAARRSRAMGPTRPGSATEARRHPTPALPCIDAKPMRRTNCAFLPTNMQSRQQVRVGRCSRWEFPQRLHNTSSPFSSRADDAVLDPSVALHEVHAEVLVLGFFLALGIFDVVGALVPGCGRHVAGDPSRAEPGNCRYDCSSENKALHGRFPL